MRESKIVHVDFKSLILTELWIEDKDHPEGGSWVVQDYIEDKVWKPIENKLKRRSFVLDKLDEALQSISRDAVKVNKGNYMASRRFRVNSVEVDKALTVMRRSSPVRKRKKSKNNLLN
tara:strand:- start:642 stop:995 length:354 start_codon:yes stop_codon:yes gene_type:complete